MDVKSEWDALHPEERRSAEEQLDFHVPDAECPVNAFKKGWLLRKRIADKIPCVTCNAAVAAFRKLNEHKKPGLSEDELKGLYGFVTKLATEAGAPNIRKAGVALVEAIEELTWRRAQMGPDS